MNQDNVDTEGINGKKKNLPHLYYPSQPSAKAESLYGMCVYLCLFLYFVCYMNYQKAT